MLEYSDVCLQASQKTLKFTKFIDEKYTVHHVGLGCRIHWIRALTNLLITTLTWSWGSCPGGYENVEYSIIAKIPRSTLPLCGSTWWGPINMANKIVQLVECSPIICRVIPKTHKWYSMPPWFTLSNLRYGSRVKWDNPGEWVAPFPKLWCSSYWKRSLWISLDGGRRTLLSYFYK